MEQIMYKTCFLSQNQTAHYEAKRAPSSTKHQTGRQGKMKARVADGHREAAVSRPVCGELTKDADSSLCFQQ